MATIDDKNLINQIIRQGGFYQEDPRAVQIVEYTNAWGNTTWGVTWSDEHPVRQRRYEEPSDYIKNPKVIWRASDHR